MTPARADAERNRARLLEAARAALASSDSDSDEIALNAVAKSAGVGQGTLYRHFPSREALVLAVYHEDVQDLVGSASELLAEHEHEPWQALRLWLDRLAAFSRVKRGLAGVLHTATRAELSSTYYAPVVGAIELLLRACRDAGVVRADVDAEDVLRLVAFLHDDNEGEARTRRLLGIVLDGLRA